MDNKGEHYLGWILDDIQNWDTVVKQEDEQSYNASDKKDSIDFKQKFLLNRKFKWKYLKNSLHSRLKGWYTLR